MLERDRPTIFLEFHPLLVAPYGHSFETIRARLSPYYPSIEYYDVPHPMPAIRKILAHYGGADVCRKLAGPPTEPMSLGRAEGTFWMVCQSTSR